LVVSLPEPEEVAELGLYGDVGLPQERAQSQHISVVPPKQELGAGMRVRQKGITEASSETSVAALSAPAFGLQML